MYRKCGIPGWLGLLAVLTLSGCQQSGVGFANIGDILAHPQKYASQEVRVRGKVTNVLKLPFVSTKLYAVRDGTGKINVRTVREAPIAGTEVRLKGILDTFGAIGDRQVGLHLREVERW